MRSELKKTTMSLCIGALLIGSSASVAFEFTPTDGDGTAFKTKHVSAGNVILARSCMPIYPDDKNETDDTNSTTT